MKKYALIIGLLVAANILVAQDRPQGPPPERGMVRIETFKERLNLTDDQMAEFKSMNKKYKPELDNIRDDESMTRSDKMRAMADIMEKQENEVAQILNENQLVELKKIQEEQKDKREDRKKDRRKGGR